MREVKLIENEILDLKDFLNKIDRLEDILNEDNLNEGNVNFIFQDNNYKTSKVLKKLNSHKLNKKIDETTKILDILLKFNVLNLRPENLKKAKENINKQIKLLNTQIDLLAKKEEASSINDLKKIGNSFLENEVFLYEKGYYYTKESIGFHLGKIFNYHLTKFGRCILKNILSLTPIFIFIGFASVLPYFLAENLPIPSIDNVYFAYAGIWGALIFSYTFLLLILYMYSNFCIYRMRNKFIIYAKLTLWILILCVMIYFLALNYHTHFPEFFQQFLEENEKKLNLLFENIIYIIYTYMAGYAVIAIIFLLKKEISYMLSTYAIFSFELICLMIFLKNPTFLVFSSIMALMFFNYVLSREKKFDYKISVGLTVIFILLSFIITAPNIARMSHIANHYGDFWIDNKEIKDLNITDDSFICDKNKDKNNTENVLNTIKYTCILYKDQNRTKFSNLLVRTEKNGEYFFRATFKGDIIDKKEDFKAPIK